MADRRPSDQPWCRVLVVDHGMGLWGAQVYLLRLAPLLAAHGVEQVLAAPAGSELATAWRDSGRAHVPMAVAVDRRLRGTHAMDTVRRVARETARNASGARQISRLARETGADVLHANSPWACPEVVAASKLAHRPLVVHMHNQLQPGPVGRFWGRAMLRADAIVAMSHATAQSLPERAAARIRLIPNGVDPEEFTPGPPDPDARAELTADPAAPVVLVLARLERDKGIEDVIRAVAALPPALAGSALAVAGGSSDLREADYEAHLRQLGRELLGDRLRLLGQRRDAPRLIRAADAVVLASRSEGFGLCVLEAQATGVPPVAYPAGGVAELITHGVDGLLARQGDVDDLARQLSRVLGDRAGAAAMGTRARQRVLAERTLDQQAAAHVRVLRTIRYGSADGGPVVGSVPAGPDGRGAAHPGDRAAPAALGGVS